eukprot:6124338-Amphidinium_carterae.1
MGSEYSAHLVLLAFRFEIHSEAMATLYFASAVGRTFFSQNFHLTGVPYHCSIDFPTNYIHSRVVQSELEFDLGLSHESIACSPEVSLQYKFRL